MKVFRVVLLPLILLFVALPLFSEAIFLQDGEIIEGRVVSETDKEISVKTGIRTIQVPREDVLRIIYSDNYKEKQYLYTADGREIVAHIVAEDRDTYTLRRELEDPDEVTLRKRDVTGVTSQSIRGAETDRVLEAPTLFTVSAGLFGKGLMSETWHVQHPGELVSSNFETIRYDQLSAGLAFDIDFNPRFPFIFRGALLYAMGDVRDLDSIYPDASESPEVNESDSFGLEFTGTIGYAFYRTEKLRLWAGPSFGYLYLNKDYEIVVSASPGEIALDVRLLYYGFAYGVNYYVTDSLYLTLEMGFSFIDGTMKWESYDENFVERVKKDLSVKGNGHYLGLGVMYRVW